MSIYDKNFYNDQFHGSLGSAEEVVPIVMKFINPKTVIDIGCGAGTWAHVFERDYGCKVTGIDGDYVPKDMILIDNFIPYDLELPIRIEEKFDLVVCLEVAEHLPLSRSREFVKDLTKLSNKILFSAATPGQGGTNHINEQPLIFWKTLFEDNGFEIKDIFRDLIKDNENIAWWYRKNIVMFEEK
jgi:cyclopropane fatty-acyl-phospholipid synthase-like methyltransferase